MSSTNPCTATVQLDGLETFACELEAPHIGLAHVNNEAGAVWCSHAEAVMARYERAQREAAEYAIHNG